MDTKHFPSSFSEIIVDKISKTITPESSLTWRTIALHIAIWIAVVMSFVTFQTVNGTYPRPLRTLVVMLCAIGGYYLNTEILIERFFEKRRYTLYICVVALCIALTTTAIFVMEAVLFEGELWHKLFVVPRRFVAAIVWISITLTLVGLLTTSQRNQRKRERETQELLTKHKEAELQFLRGQINPHFLFNTLNNIYALAIVQSPQTAPMLMRLSKLLRYSIYTTQKPTVKIQEEITEIRELLTLFQLRSEEPLNITFTVGGSINGQSIEPMILFSLVENCLKHSDIAHNENGFIAINLVVQEQTVYFSTLNSKDNSNMQKDSVGGVGLVNIRQRLALKYGEQSRLIVNDSPTRFEVCLTIPFV
jgi:two-component system LytT family sensor kinase